MRRREALIAVATAFASPCGGGILSAQLHKAVQDTKPREQSFGEKLGIVIPGFQAAGKPMAEIAVEMAFRYKLPMAIEHVDAYALRKPIRMKVGNQTARQLIDAAVASVSGYRVVYDQGLVDIYSPASRQDVANPLNSVIGLYDVEGLDTHLADAQLLCDLVRQLRGHAGCGGSVAGGQWGPVKISLHLENRRVYEILNAIVAQNGSALWIPTAQPVSSVGMMRNFWYIYPLAPPFQVTVTQELQKLLPPEQSAQ